MGRIYLSSSFFTITKHRRVKVVPQITADSATKENLKIDLLPLCFFYCFIKSENIFKAWHKRIKVFIPMSDCDNCMNLMDIAASFSDDWPTWKCGHPDNQVWRVVLNKQDDLLLTLLYPDPKYKLVNKVSSNASVFILHMAIWPCLAFTSKEHQMFGLW